LPVGVHSTGPILLFTGAMDYRPNVDAVAWFVHNAFPTIRRASPTAEFWVVGQRPSARVLALAGRAGVRVTGAVPDIRPYLRAASVYVVPMRIGGGTRFKVLEAMASSVPVVSTRLGVDGIGVQESQQALLAD